MNMGPGLPRNILLVLLLGTALALPARSSQTSAEKQRKQLLKEEQKYEDLQRHLASQKGMKQAETLAQLAAFDFDFAHAEYGAGRAASGERYLRQAQVFAAQSMQIARQQAATGHTGGMKKIEMQFQKVSFGLRDLARSVDFFHRPPIEAAHTWFSNQRANLLTLMFSPKK